MFIYLYAFLAGVVLGSFYMVIAIRVPVGKSIVTPQSYCHYCKHALKPKELIPIISFWLQKGRCTYCKKKIPNVYILFEAVTGSLFLLTAYIIGIEKELIVVLSLFSLLLIITVTDLVYMLIPDRILIYFGCLLIIECIFVPLVFWGDSVTGGGTIFVTLYIIQRIHPKGLGGGDVKLLSLLGFIIGVKGIFITLCLASCFGFCFFKVSLLLKRITVKEPMPFGPFIAIGTVCYMLIVYSK
ncbi:prepilin peptidase [Bacillus clarus]|uniref:Prepilin peptidase n=1 Tax=Bacillus clarus TaxID=2338372 RepID=A0A090ZHI8_9BACI|nr:A24 family peptidase [Bacillus clarus]KFN03701.1 type IV leader peptidase family protein [Bacillus clarus]RFT62354.1 prepilin peptidase [Bacillus clarus]